LNAPPEGSGDDARLLYERVFVRGARIAAGYFGDGLGTIAAGAPADLVLLDYDPATELSPRTLASHLANGLLRAPRASWCRAR
jgi:cytosine/adenosine deaminase-related metal-dependent hydrolase